MEREIKDTLESLRGEIRKERPYVGKKPYSHNLITLTLGLIEQDYGLAAANETIKICKLYALGWRPKKVKK